MSASVIDRVRGKIVNYDERRGIVTIQAPYEDFARMCRREYKEVEITMIDSRPRSDRQRRSCYAMIREIADWMGDTPESTKEVLKLDFLSGELLEIADNFSLSNAPMSVVAAFQTWLAKFILRNDIPTKKPMLEYVDDIDDYVYACIINKKCPICGKKADLHHLESVGMGRDRTEIIHEGMEVMPLCREHHTEIHTIGKDTFLERYHLNGGIPADKTICRIYKLRSKMQRKLRGEETHEETAHYAERNQHPDDAQPQDGQPAAPYGD